MSRNTAARHPGHETGQSATGTIGQAQYIDWRLYRAGGNVDNAAETALCHAVHRSPRSEEHTSELQSLLRISYAVFCLKKKQTTLLTHIYSYSLRISTPYINT